MTVHGDVTCSYSNIVRAAKRKADAIAKRGREYKHGTGHISHANMVRVHKENVRLGIVPKSRARPFRKRRHKSGAPVTLAKVNLPE